MTINLPDELRNAVSARPLAPLEIIDEQSQVSYVVMPMQVYREMMGVGTDAEHADSLAAIHEGLAGRGRKSGRCPPTSSSATWIANKRLDRRCALVGRQRHSRLFRRCQYSAGHKAQAYDEQYECEFNQQPSARLLYCGKKAFSIYVWNENRESDNRDC